MKRRSPMGRSEPIRRSAGLSGPKAPRLGSRNKQRLKQAANVQRAYGGESRIQWVQGLPCLVCGNRPSENAHVRTGGMGRKADAKWVVPLCTAHHQMLHQYGRQTFESKHGGIDLDQQAAITDSRWEVYKNQLTLEIPG